MIPHHFKTAWRNIVRHKTYALLNIAGLSLSLAMAITIFCIIRFEAGFDSFHTNANRLYKLIAYDNVNEAGTHIPQGVMRALREEIPGIERAATVHRFIPSVIRVAGHNLKQDNVFFMHPEFFEMIDLEWVHGSPETSLSKPYQVVLDEATALKLFNGDAMGKTIRYDNQFDITVSGIIKKMPANSDFQLEMLLSYETLTRYMPWLAEQDYWSGGDSHFQGFVLLKPGTDPNDVETRLRRLIEPHAQSGRSHYTAFRLSPLPAIHFDTVTNDNFNYVTPQWLLYVLASAAIFLVLIACINFINIAIVHAMQRNKETAVRKILGGSKRQIVFGFLAEANIIIAMAMLAGILLATYLLPYLGALLNTQVAMSNNWGLMTWLFILATGTVVALVSGVYPAWVLSRFQPVELLRTKLFSPAGKGLSLRKSLVVAQFVIAQLLVVCTLIGIRQVNYLYKKDLGFEQASVVTVNMPKTDNVFRERLRGGLLKHTAIKDVTYGLTTPSGTGNWWWTHLKYRGLENGEENFRQQFVDTNYFNFFRIPIVAGRSFVTSDSTRAFTMINEKAARNMGFNDPAGALGENVTMWNDNYEVIGVVRDYNSQSLKSGVTPHVYFYNGRFMTAAVRIEPVQSRTAIDVISREWKSIFPDYFFEYKFLDDDLKSFYSDESKFSGVLSLFSVASIIISCLGIYSLVSLICRRKIKEIGIRKTLGATKLAIVNLLSRDFARLVFVAIVIASPLAWWIMNKWLEEFNYRAGTEWWIFAGAGLAAMVVALITVGWQAMRAAAANPVKSLKEE